MANKKVPESIAGVDLHEMARYRTNALLRTLRAFGAEGVDEEELSMIDRFRLLASAFFLMKGAGAERAKTTTKRVAEPHTTDDYIVEADVNQIFRDAGIEGDPDKVPGI